MWESLHRAAHATLPFVVQCSCPKRLEKHYNAFVLHAFLRYETPTAVRSLFQDYKGELRDQLCLLSITRLPDQEALAWRNHQTIDPLLDLVLNWLKKEPHCKKLVLGSGASEGKI